MRNDTKYDPEIDPSIREALEAAERDRELTEKIRREIERYSRQNPPEEDTPPFDPDPTESAPARPKTKKRIASIISGSILSDNELRKFYPYLIGFALLLLLYIANIFGLQRLYRTQQRLDAEIKELRTRSVELSATRMQHTQRSSIVRQAREQGLNLKESTTPVKIIEK